MIEELAWGFTRFTYSKDQIEKLYQTMDANGWDTTRTIGALCCFPIFSLNEETLPAITHLMDKLRAWMVIEGRNFERIWTAMNEHDKQLYQKIESCPTQP